MTAKRPNGEKLAAAPLEKRGRLEETNVDEIDAELDYEVEKELREFERIQSGLLSTTSDQQNGNAGVRIRSHVVARESKEQEENASGSDMELEELEQEIPPARKTKTIVHNAPYRSKLPVLDETAKMKDIRILPDTFAEENLRGDDLVEKLGVLGDGEEACLDMEQVQTFKDVRAVDPLLSPVSPIPQLTHSNLMDPESENSRSKPEQLEVALALQLKQMQQLEPDPEPEDPNDPDFSPPRKRKSRSRVPTNRSKTRRSELGQASTKKHRAGSGYLTSKSSERVPKKYHEDLDFEDDEEPTEPSLPPLTRMKRQPSLPKEAFVDPVLKIPVQPKSLYADTKFRDPIFGNVSKPAEASRIRRDTSEILQSSGYHKRNQWGEHSAGVEIPEKTALKQHHVRAINFNETATRSSPLAQHTEAVKSTLPRLTPPEQVSPQHQDEPNKPGPSNPKPPKHPAYLDFLRNSKNSANPVPRSEEQDRREQGPSPENPKYPSRPSTATVDQDQPAKYCAVEQIIQRRFKNSFLLDEEKLEMIRADRPKIWSPEFYPYMIFHESLTWLAACNELKRFFCWPCLLSASKVTWSVTCEDTSESVLSKEIHKHKQSPVHQDSIKQLDALILAMKKESGIINNLLINNFVDGTWTEQNQEAIIMKGRPQPILDSRTIPTFKADKNSAFKKFYDKFKWICGCSNSGNFYCWPCLLFSGKKWAYAGTIEFSGDLLANHETTQVHMEACSKLGEWEFDLRKKPKANNEGIEKTWNLVTCLAEILCAEKKKINNADFSPLDLVESLELMSGYNEKLRILMDEISKYSKSQVVPLYSTAILDSVEFFMKDKILEEIKSSNFVSLIFDHSSGLSNKAVLSVIARYVDGNGQVHERFIKLLNVGYNTPSNMLIDEFFQIIIELHCRSNLVGFTYDGYLVKPGSIPEFNAKVQKLCPNAKFFHYSEHGFNRVLKQTLCHVPVCRKVLQAVKELASFLESMPRARNGVVDIVTAAGNSQREDIWRSSNFIKTVFEFHARIVEILENICKKAREYPVKTVVQASNFLDFFKDTTNRFFVTLMARIFNAVEDLSEEVEQDVGIENLRTIANHTALEIQKLGRNFDSLIKSACSHLEESKQEKPHKEMSALREQFSNVVRLVVKLVKTRIFDLESGYFKISKEEPSNSAHFIKLKRQNLILHTDAFPPNFKPSKLSKELEFFHNSSMFSGLGLSEIIPRIKDYNMVEVLPELVKFVQLALTIPKERFDATTIPAVRRISAYVEGKKDMNSTDALIWMEKDVLSNLQKVPHFYEKVTDRVISIVKKDSLKVIN